MRRGTQICVSMGAVICVCMGAWTQAETPEDVTGPEATPEEGPAERPQAREESEIVEVSRPAAAVTPVLSKEDLTRILSAYKVPQLTSVEQRASLQQTLLHLQAGELAPAAETWTRCVSEFIRQSGRKEIEGLILYILNESFLQPDPDLLMHAEKARFFNEQESVVHQHLSALRKFESARASDAIIERPILSRFVPGGTAVRSREREQVSWEEIGERIETWDRRRITIEEDARLANSELQKTMVRRRANIYAISAALQMMHEVADQISENPAEK